MHEFSASDLQQISEHGLTPEKVASQLDQFKKGFPSMKLYRAATPGDGIRVIRDKDALVSQYEEKAGRLKIMKFVPASGAASRMFKALFAFMEDNRGTGNQTAALRQNEKVNHFFGELDNFAFYHDLENEVENGGDNLAILLDNGRYAEVLEYLLTEKGLNYGNLPKGLLKFHDYGEEQRLPIEEHLVEGAAYAKDSEGKVRIHFTVSPEHMELFRERVEALKGKYEKAYGVSYEVTYSVQKSATDTVAASEDFEPFRNDDGTLLFRPAGHGALIENLNDVDTDIAFIKNIDNVVPDSRKNPTIESKKLLGGVLLEMRERIDEIYSKLENEELDVEEAEKFFKEELHIIFTEKPSRETMLKKLDRPLRVCGMVINQGDPGGGPYWCHNRDNTVSLQIVESSQFNTGEVEQMNIVDGATHFNPVDVVVLKTDRQGEPYDLLKHVDPETGFISDKSKSGRKLKAMELPGLWNGSMSDWNTIFVEVPAETFSPVKEVTDLLRPMHRQ